MKNSLLEYIIISIHIRHKMYTHLNYYRKHAVKIAFSYSNGSLKQGYLLKRSLSMSSILIVNCKLMPADTGIHLRTCIVIMLNAYKYNLNVLMSSTKITLTLGLLDQLWFRNLIIRRREF